MAGGGGGGGRELDQTPTWAVASVCVTIIVVSIALEKALHRLGHFFTEKKKKALFEALEKVKADYLNAAFRGNSEVNLMGTLTPYCFQPVVAKFSFAETDELMILGFISLLLTFGQNYIAKICIPEKAADTMLPCSLKVEKEESAEKRGGHRRLLWDASVLGPRRFLATAVGSTCPNGKVPLVSINGIHQLHIFIFFLAVFHVIYSAITMALGRAKIRRWKEWEKETQSLEYEYSNDPSRFRLAHETSFVKQHTSFWNKIPIIFYILSFFRQFYRSVRKADYLTMRHGFISVHLAPGSKFDFQRYIKRSLEDDFIVIVGISKTLWASLVILLLLNVNGWQTLFWASFLPLIILLAVGTKLQAIITKMALEIKERHVVVQGVPLVTLSDHHFWFERPHLVLNIIHFTLFQNAFQIIYFLWILYSFGLRSCFHTNMNLIIARLCLGVSVQFLCSYVTLPLYALVSQMGSHMKKSIFDEQTSQAIKKWHQAVKKKKQRKPSAHSPPSATPGAASPPHLMQRFKTVGHSAATLRYLSDHDSSEAETEMLSPSSSGTPNRAHDDLELGPAAVAHGRRSERGADDFSFEKLPGPAK